MTEIPRRSRASRSVRVALALFLGGVSFAGGECGEQPLPPLDWRLAGDRLEVPGLHSQGIATVPALGPTDRVYTSRVTMDRTVDGDIVVLGRPLEGAPAAAGFDHVGDIDAVGTLVYAPLEDLASVQIPYRRGFGVYDAESLELLGGSLETGGSETATDGDNAWVAVSPDGRWLVSSDWSPQNDLRVYAVDEIGALGEIEPVLEIPLDRTIRRVQGCDFDGPRVLLCASDDGDAGRPLYALVLSDALDGPELASATSAEVVELFPLPTPSSGCGVDPEVEGVDVEGREMHVMVIGPCLVDTHTYRFVRSLAAP